jgi:magnesium transporter
MARRLKRLKNTLKSVGKAPGSLIYIGETVTPVSDVTITINEYNQQTLKSYQAKTVEECLTCRLSSFNSWINIDGVHNVEIIKTLGEQFGLHQLTLEDILNTEIRPKIEVFESYILIIVKMLRYNNLNKEIEAEQVSLVLGDNYVLSFQENREGDVFDNIRLRIANPNGRHRKSGPDYLLYSLLDAVVDHYFIVLERIGEKLEDLEEDITGSPSQQLLSNLYALKQDLVFMRRSVWPLREIISGLEREETVLIKKEIRKYIRDIYDHTIQVIDTTESFRDSTGSLLDLYLSSMSNRTNDVMKVLTMISTIFMPLTFIAGVYGMNFENMPELRWEYGYFVTLGVMAISIILMLMWFRRKKWL